MGPKSKATSTGLGQTRLDGFFTKSGAQPSLIRYSSTQSSESNGQILQSTKLSPSVTTELPLSPKRPVRQSLAAKRSFDDDSDDGIIPIPVRPVKSPRTSPQPESRKSLPQHVRQDSHSSLSSLKSSATPLSPIHDSIETRAATSTSFRPPPQYKAHRQTPPDSRPQTSESQASAMTASFGSNRTAVPSSSARVVKNGQEMVLNSDSEGSDDSLLELDDLLAPSKAPVASSSPLTELSRSPTPPAQAFGTRRNRSATPQSTKFLTRGAQAPKSKLRFSLADLVARNEQQQSEKARAAETLKVIEELDKSTVTPHAEASSEDHLQSVIAGTGAEGDDAERLRDALSRTESLAQDKHWLFFDYERFNRRVCEVKLASLDPADHSATSFFRDEDGFREMLVCGYGKQLLSIVPTTRGLANWLFQHALYDVRGDVRSACSQAFSYDPNLSSELMSTLIREELQRMGMRDEMIGLQHKSITPARMPERQSTAAAGGIHIAALRQLLIVIATCAPCADIKGASEIMVTLTRMAVDDSINYDTQTMTLLVSAVKAHLDVFSQAVDGTERLTDVLHTAFEQTADDDFRLRILDAFPLTSPLAAFVRKKLATAWFYDDPSVLQRHLRSYAVENHGALPALVDFDQISQYLRTNRKIFKITHHTKWSLLKSKLELLSIVVGSGDAPDPADGQQPGGGPYEKVFQAKEASKAYDKAVDGLAHVIASMHSLIADTGTSHISQTEAKDILQRFKLKLSHTIRTKPPPRRDPFATGLKNIKEAFKRMKPGSISNPAGEKGTVSKHGAHGGPQAQSEAATEINDPAHTHSPLQSAITPSSEYHDAVDACGDTPMRSETEFETAVESPSI